MKKVLIIGSKGMAGHMIKNYLYDKPNIILGEIARGNVENAEKGIYNIDVTNLRDVEYSINNFNPDYIVNCIGILNKDAEASPDKAIFLNSFFPHYLAKLATASNSKLFHISTDCVFSGKSGNYETTSLKDGNGFYAQSKSLGEVYYDNHLTVRTSIIGPEIKTNGIGLLHWFLRNQSVSIDGYKNALWTGVTTLQLAKSLYSFMFENNLSGIIHLTNNQKISKYELLLIFKKVFKKYTEIVPDQTYKIDKSLFSELILPMSARVPSYDQMILEMRKWMLSNSDLYSEIYDIS
jgi:dTDP-4-dehydrorhamnose reductase